jgi:hypothetical protein
MIVKSWKDTAGLPIRQRIRWGLLRWAPGPRETLIHLIDARSRLLGYCNHKPWRGNLDDGGGGYPTWRCAHLRGHSGRHRSINYVWDDSGRTEYKPVQFGPVNRFAYKHIHGQSYTQRLARARWHRREEDRRRAARKASA